MTPQKSRPMKNINCRQPTSTLNSTCETISQSVVYLYTMAVEGHVESKALCRINMTQSTLRLSVAMLFESNSRHVKVHQSVMPIVLCQRLEHTRSLSAKSYSRGLMPKVRSTKHRNQSLSLGMAVSQSSLSHVLVIYGVKSLVISR